ncbi:MAG TPA: NADPH:quinone reductase [Pseudolabrys sp.]|uniref:NADPH:quinone reductase n=1 Tax=Pseudolabrys sp. TaxID=1960880 RepID=UPI002DDD9177|nr:NADPH:quinone reductase [Pseudolabrys sp.]HEV2630623.1 NADPH:quinone reductase [Pseudolabrys sp.]
MRAAWYEKNGAAREVLRVGETETPRAGAGEVRVKLATSGVNPSDVKSRQGLTRKIAWPRLVPQSDGAGVIDEVGAGVPASRIGERVWVWNGQWKRAFGTAAEYITLPAAQAVPLPDRTSFAEGACLGIPAMTAYHAVALANLPRGGRVLVSGGAGAVGQYVIQFAKQRGATVLTTVSSPEKAAAAREAGADHTIDYKREDVAAKVKAVAPDGVDAIIEMDLAANAKLIPSVLRPKGSVIVYGTTPEATLPAGWCLTNGIRIQFFLVYELTEADRAAAVAAINDGLKAGTLKNRVAQPTFPLADIAAAHEAVEKGSLGNVVVTM